MFYFLSKEHRLGNMKPVHDRFLNVGRKSQPKAVESTIPKTNFVCLIGDPIRVNIMKMCKTVQLPRAVFGSISSTRPTLNLTLPYLL